ncbi:hypothetical protein NEOLI_004858 [Neolecta irregularis DAH-3]|uniref:Ubiquitin 3 binding protein But2 C-terminal domain-containing protein n=1 Tax=Neolecta irregularis (strain DAH-3) TaxID=1198029 RepID=A0A1U7LNT9_NEOID|nr:hypothetical protein NEOLI_004858 [Neolecta irregularis DAH-3]|eukprot:OLL24317.1 hypothetical protein NEOLI_004858 [Neolecta irregularis DAH-3]
MQFTAFSATLFATIAVASPAYSSVNQPNTIYPKELVALVEDSPYTNFFGANGYTGHIANELGKHLIHTVTSFNIDDTQLKCTVSFVISQDADPENFSFTPDASFDVWEYTSFSPKEITWKSHTQEIPKSYIGRIFIEPSGESNELSFQCKSSSIALLMTPRDNDTVDIEWTEGAQPTLGLIMTQK